MIDKNKKYILYFDIDGTLSEENSPLTLRVINAINGAKAKGHKVVISTGRCLYAVGDWIQKAVEWDAIIGSCGTSIMVEGRIVYSNPMDREVVKNVAQFCIDNNTPVVFEGEDFLGAINFQIDIFKPTYLFTMEDFIATAYNRNTSKLTFKPDMPKELLPILAGHDVIFHHYYTETVIKGNSKAIGNGVYKKMAQLDDRQTICFGDSNNDIEMLDACDYGVVMGGATEEVKKHATFVTTSLKEDGVAVWIEENLL